MSLMPTYGSKGASAFDLRIAQRLVLKPGEIQKVGTGIKVAVPEGMGLFIIPRSSTQFELWNTVGLVDTDYRGEIFLKIHNKSREAILLERGDRVAQACLIPVVRVVFDKVNNLDVTERGDGGFGSTGAK